MNSHAQVEYQRAKPDDMTTINSMYFEEYGKNYPYPLKPGSFNSGFHLTAKQGGKVIGFARATEYNPETHTYEFGGVIVARPHRRQGIARKLTYARLEHIKSHGGRVAFSEPVCNRPDKASQINLMHRGFVPVGIALCKYPDLKQRALGIQPESCLVAVRDLKKCTGFGYRRIYMPQHLKELLNGFIPESVMLRGWFQIMDGPMPKCIHQNALNGSRSSGSAFIDIPINWPEAEAKIQAFESDGYHFCGILPGFGRTSEDKRFDYARFVRPPKGLRIDMSKVHVVKELEVLHGYLAQKLN